MAVNLDWSEIASTTIGGITTIIAAYLTFWWANRADHQRQIDAERKASAASAMSGYFKLSQWADIIGNIKLHLDESFEAAREGGIDGGEPFAFVGPTSGLLIEPERLKSDEFSFLLNVDSFDLIGKVILIEQRSANYNHLLNEYSNLHVGLQDWLDSLPGFKRTMDGPIAADEIRMNINQNSIQKPHNLTAS